MIDIRYDENGLVPVIAQDLYSGKILMQAYANREALLKTIETGKAHYYSRSRKRLWKKGGTSGNFQDIRNILVDCDADSLIYQVIQTGSACHTGERSCFYRKIDGRDVIQAVPEDPSEVLKELFEVIMDRKQNPKEGSYTNYLFEKGIDKILKKIGEESAETIIAAKNDDKHEIAMEMSDLMYHLLVMLAEKNMDPNDIFRELKKRR
jgi:phosphoribosyl-AMP cyclohydrolase / phosphoribosyl-ATP pyrophosphohydrolase